MEKRFETTECLNHSSTESGQAHIHPMALAPSAANAQERLILRKGHHMKYLLALLFVAAVTSGAAAADTAPLQTIHLTNGAIATSYDHCGDMDLCAKVAYPDGTALSIYSEGAAECQPYELHFVYSDTTKTVFEFSRALNHTHAKDAGCGHTIATEMVLDRGYVHMLFTENSDGTINAAFSVAKE